MNRLSVTIVDVMAFLVPGVVVLFGLVLLPLPDAWVTPLNDSLLRRVPLVHNPWIEGGCWVIAAYVLGFLLRLTSIELMNRLTSHKWANRVETEGTHLASALETAVGNHKLSSALKALAEVADKRGVGRISPYFHLAKRIVRTQPTLWAEAERLEAEVRFSAGLFVPFFLMAVDGLLRVPWDLAGALILLVIGSAGSMIVFFTFPDRRVKEVQYVLLLALVALRPSALTTADTHVPSE